MVVKLQYKTYVFKGFKKVFPHTGVVPIKTALMLCCTVTDKENKHYKYVSLKCSGLLRRHNELSTEVC